MRMKRLTCEAAVDAMIKAGLKADRKKALKLLFQLYDRHGYEYKRIFQTLLKELTGKVDYGIVAAGVVAYRKERAWHLMVYPDVLPTIDKLRRKGLKLAIVSDAPRMKAWIRLAEMGIQDRFDAVVTFDDTKVRKPDFRPFRLALKKLKARPQEAMMVGDWITRDILPAKELGMTAVLAEYGITKKTKGNGKPDFRIKRFRELLKIIGG
jgi:putative hydrolase of the HAD superfamily